MSDRVSAEERAERLAEEVKKNLKSDLDDRVQRELANLLRLLPALRDSRHSNMLGEAEIVLNALLLENPNLTLATSVRKGIAREIWRMRRARHPFLAITGRSASPSTRVILGLGFLLYIGIPVLLRMSYRMKEEILGLPSDLLSIAVLTGGIGSIVSIMVRIHDFSGLRDADPAVLLFTGFFKPVIGASFALFVLACLKSGIIPVTVQPETEQYFIAALSFVAGFSERFAKDIASSVERNIPVGLVQESAAGHPTNPPPQPNE